MPLFLMYILVVIAFAIATFASLSRGSLFNEKVKFIVLIFAIIVLIVMCILASIWYSWLNIFGLIGTGLVSLWVFGFILQSTIFKK